MSTFVFSSKEELLNQAKKDIACQRGFEWAKQQDSLETILKEIPLEYRIWCLKKGYMQFTEHCKWELLSGHEWVELLYLHPNLSSFCSYWDKLNGDDWIRLIYTTGKFSEYCSWDKLEGLGWSVILSKFPQFSEYCDWKKLNKTDWYFLLRSQPQLEKFKT